MKLQHLRLTETLVLESRGEETLAYPYSTSHSNHHWRACSPGLKSI